jgi:hypothetical protein
MGLCHSEAWCLGGFFNDLLTWLRGHFRMISAPTGDILIAAEKTKYYLTMMAKGR